MSSVVPLIAVDIGNTRIKFGVFLDWQTPAEGRLPSCSVVLAEAAETVSIPWDQLRSAIGNLRPRCIVASVNPPALESFLREWSRTGWDEPVVVRSFEQLPIVNQTEPPEQTGLDRLLKGVAGNVLRAQGHPLILVDSGTATTVDWITPTGAFAGGAILPGLALSSQALHDHTAQLPLISSEDIGQNQPAPIGKNTVEALRSGLYWGHVGAVRELILQLSARSREPDVQVLITGGAGELLARELKSANYCRDLTLQGLAIAARQLLSCSTQSGA